MREKRATSAEGKTIRIAESSDMDSWEAVLRPCAKVLRKCASLEKVEMCYPTIPNDVV